MKLIKLLVATALFATASAAPIAPASASQTDNNGANAELHAFCQELIANGTFPTLSLGECMSFNRTSASGFAAHFCDFIRENEDFADYGFTSYSDCVRNITF